MPPSIIPVVQTWGTREALRYAVTDTTGRFWTGTTWAKRQREALLYASHADAAFAAHFTLMKQFRLHTCYQQFVVPLSLHVFANGEVQSKELRDFARKAVKFSMLYANHGTGPRPDSLVAPLLKWYRMTQPINSERDFHIDE